MIFKRAAFALTLALAAGVAVAGAPELSLRPLARPLAEAPVTRAVVVPSTALAVSVSPRPPRRPDLARAVAASVTITPPRVVMVSASTAAVRLSPRPPARPDNLERRTTVRAAGVRTQPGLPLLTGRRGSVCGLVAIQGETVAPIPGRISGCGIDDPVKVTSVSGITLSQAAIMDCTTARALNAWVDQAVVPAVGRLGGGLAGLQVAAHYSCRTRNNQPGHRHLGPDPEERGADLCSEGLGRPRPCPPDAQRACRRLRAVRHRAGPRCRPVPQGPFPLRHGKLPQRALLQVISAAPAGARVQEGWGRRRHSRAGS